MNERLQRRIGLVLTAVALTAGVAHAQQDPPERRDARPAFATQQTRSLQIRDGLILIDGRPLAASDVPDGLVLDGVEAQFNWVGIERPVVQLGAGFYAVEADRLVAEPEFWLNQLRQAPPTPLQKVVPMENINGVIFDTDRGQAYTLSGQPLAEAEAKQELARGTDNLYLNDLQTSNVSLFRQLTTERQMELRTLQLARRMRVSTDAAEQKRLREELTGLLDEIFELKSRNRLAEIRQLEGQLDELRTSLEQRERMKAALIEARLQQLVGPDR